MDGKSDSFLTIARSLAQDSEASRITSLQSPAVAETLGRALAAELAPHNPDLVVVWDHVETAVLGHVVARELDAGLIYAYSVEGALGLSGELASGSAVILLSYDWTEDPGLHALVRMVQVDGSRVVGIGSVVPASSARQLGIEAVSLSTE